MSFGALSRFGGWIAGLSGVVRAGGLALLGLAAGAAAWGVHEANAEAQMLRADINVASADPAVMKYATGRGRAVFASFCASCHGGDAQGNVPDGVPNLADKEWLYGEGTPSDIETVVRYGIRAPNGKTLRQADMPAFARPVPYPRETALKPLRPGQINDVIQFLALQRGAKADPSAAARGATVFSGEGGCYDCHAGDGGGDSAIGGPNLRDNVWLYGGADQTVFQSIAYGRAGFCPAFLSKITPAKIREAALYVYSLSHPTPRKPSSSAQ